MVENRDVGKPAKPRFVPAPSPHRQLRETLFHTLPTYSGPYSVGTIEIELPVREPRTFSHIKRDNMHALRMDTVLFSIYYPCDSSEFTKGGKAKPSRATWLPRPRVPTCKGYAKFLNIPHFPVTAYIAATTMFTKLPAFRNAKLDSRRPSGQQPNDRRDSEETLGQDTQDKPIFPVIFFSHGLGGSRTCYSSICGEMASNGFIVVAVEHRDGSGARSYVNIPPSGNLADGKILDNTKSKRSYMVDYIWPKDNAQDTSPHNQRGVDTELRSAQIEMRMAEIEEAYYAMELINNDQGVLISKSNLRRKGNVGSSSVGTENVDWAEWASRMHLDKVTMMGHSFGGATTIQISREDARFPWVGQAITLDAWGPAIPKSPDGATIHVRKPLLAIGSEAFMHWPENFEAVVDVCRDTRDNGAPCWMMTIKGSTHLSQTDFAVLYPRWMSWFAKNMVNPRRAVLLTTNASFEFLKKVLPVGHTQGNIWMDEGILGTETLSLEDSLPSENKPDNKWIAARLRIPNEFRLRVLSWFRRTKAHPDVPRDATGKPLVSIVTRPLGDEVWMHISPEKTDNVDPPVNNNKSRRVVSRNSSFFSGHRVLF
ncbi:phospholipase A2 [Xylariales sp. PMI_506]|nr:phospholipase A2 [Xylariales sp. PMI_506]